MDVSPPVSKDRQIIESYSARGFRISGVFHEGAVLILPQATHSWPIAAFAALSLESLGPILEVAPRILLLGCGAKMERPPASLRAALRQRGIVLDAMDTGAACRTYNVLLAEDREVAAALLPAQNR